MAEFTIFKVRGPHRLFLPSTNNQIHLARLMLQVALIPRKFIATEVGVASGYGYRSEESSYMRRMQCWALAFAGAATSVRRLIGGAKTVVGKAVFVPDHCNLLSLTLLIDAFVSRISARA